MLDTRSFRDAHLIPSVGATLRGVPVLGRLTPLLAAATRLVSMWFAEWIDFGSDVLGEAQWAWLETQLTEAQNSKFVVLLTSIQFGTSNPSFESWGHFPRAKRRLLELLARTAGPAVLLISGDVHHAELIAPPATRFVDETPLYDCGQLVEVTTSGMTHTISTSLTTRLLFPPLIWWFSRHRASPQSFSTEYNYATLAFDYDAAHVDVRVRGPGENVLLAARLAPRAADCASRQTDSNEL